MNLTDKICIITGGASGIGLDIARTFAEAGGKIIIADIDIDAANKAAKDLGEGHMGVDMDVTDEAAVQRGVDKVIEAYGRVDVLVSNAGIQIVKRVAASAHPQFLLAPGGRIEACNAPAVAMATDTRACCAATGCWPSPAPS